MDIDLKEWILTLIGAVLGVILPFCMRKVIEMWKGDEEFEKIQGTYFGYVKNDIENVIIKSRITISKSFLKGYILNYSLISKNIPDMEWKISIKAHKIYAYYNSKEHEGLIILSSSIPKEVNRFTMGVMCSCRKYNSSVFYSLLFVSSYEIPDSILQKYFEQFPAKSIEPKDFYRKTEEII